MLVVGTRGSVEVIFGVGNTVRIENSEELWYGEEFSEKALDMGIAE